MNVSEKTVVRLEPMLLEGMDAEIADGNDRNRRAQAGEQALAELAQYAQEDGAYDAPMQFGPRRVG